ncbi:hypothetical protein SDC9_206351 [bioreactor metagenome]|uniref:Uncharacterized protein n=1 Tax=bioreactor metagenome TaxID=1076179 RepID=A0A645JGC5_9ZZZZ
MYDLFHLTHAYEVYDRKSGTMSQRIYAHEYPPPKRDKTHKEGRIPHPGAAKAGWLHGLRNLPGGYRKEGNLPEWAVALRNKNLVNVAVVHGDGTYGIMIENLVKYIQKISPNAAAIAMRSAASRMEKAVQAEINKVEKKLKW